MPVRFFPDHTMKIPNLILTLGLCLFSIAGTGCKKKASEVETAAASSITEADRQTIFSAIAAKKYDAALEALGKLQAKVKTDQDADAYRRAMKDTMTRLILVGDDENAKAALSTLRESATGR
jgi:hypothetical protein